MSSPTLSNNIAVSILRQDTVPNHSVIQRFGFPEGSPGPFSAQPRHCLLASSAKSMKKAKYGIIGGLIGAGIGGMIFDSDHYGRGIAPA